MPEIVNSSQTNHDYSECYIDCMRYMVCEVTLANENVREEERSNCQEPFCNMVQVAQHPLYDGRSAHIELSTAV